MKIGLFAAQLVLPAVPGLYVILFRPGVSLLTPRMLIPSMLCINLLALLLGWRRLGWSRNERLDAAMLLVMFALFPWLEYRVLPVGAFEGNLWAQVGCYCAGQAIGYVSVVLAPDWLGRLRQRRYEERVLVGAGKVPIPQGGAGTAGRSAGGAAQGERVAQGEEIKTSRTFVVRDVCFRGVCRSRFPGCQSANPSVCPSVNSSVRRPASPSARQSFGLPVCPPVSPLVRLSVCLSVCLSAGSLVCKLVSPSVRCSARREGGIAACCRFTGSAGC